MKKRFFEVFMLVFGFLIYSSSNGMNAANNPVMNPCIQRPHLAGCGANSSAGQRTVIHIPNRWGAIYFNPENFAIGYSSNNKTSYRSAEKEALAGCIRAGGGQNPIAPDGKGCRLLTKYRNACGAIAVGEEGYGARNHAYLEEAEKNALAACSKHSAGCKIYHSECSRDPRYQVGR